MEEDSGSPRFYSIVAVLSTIISLVAWQSRVARSIIKFTWNCFLKPVRGSDQSARLNSFYAGQADVYDDTRGGLLKGRETLLQLVAGQLKTQGRTKRVERGDRKPKIWIDIGGGTGWNIQAMDDFFPVSNFDAIYLIDLCEPLLEVAKTRFARKGWKNVHCLQQDASKFVLPEWSNGQLPEAGQISLVTMSYSLSMIPTFQETLNRVQQVLDPEDGIIGVVDFYAGRERELVTKGGKERSLIIQDVSSLNLDTGLVNSWFWTTWFSFDHVHLHPSRRSYLQQSFEVIKCINGRNRFIIPSLVKIPYYVYLGKRSPSTSLSTSTATDLAHGTESFRIVNGLLTPESPFSSAISRKDLSEMMLPDMSIGESAWSNMINREEEAGSLAKRRTSLDTALRQWRVPYAEQRVHKQFRTHIYGWTWEDPQCDIDRLGIKDGDSLLCITSAGDNVLHYAIKADIEIQSVDMNPCQGHILELKLAASQALEYHDFWHIFGEGKHSRFEKLLDTKIAPYLSAQAYAYWKVNADQFSSNFFLRGYSGWAIRLARVAFALAGVSKDVKKMISCNTTAEQDAIWKKKLRPILLNPVMRLILGSGFFCWNALGVPRNQLNCLLEDGDIAEFISATLDPVPGLANMKNGAYHYFLCLNGKYTRASCPLYLTPEGFAELKRRNGQKTAKIKMHTDTILK
ncbi:hypothetical protein QFC19_004731 [Naganishia cerealis]|uniref:Uncharacterized protein n=1 Tax=Naganishia cerealis TaxID=610337 RepID=A0ACC2VTE9_9TREE|nr:hypothetical protein QFC19_004731 [Naganishia cerealis]